MHHHQARHSRIPTLICATPTHPTSKTGYSSTQSKPLQWRYNNFLAGARRREWNGRLDGVPDDNGGGGGRATNAPLSAAALSKAPRIPVDLSIMTPESEESAAACWRRYSCTGRAQRCQLHRTLTRRTTCLTAVHNMTMAAAAQVRKEQSRGSAVALSCFCMWIFDSRGSHACTSHRPRVQVQTDTARTNPARTSQLPAAPVTARSARNW